MGDIGQFTFLANHSSYMVWSEVNIFSMRNEQTPLKTTTFDLNTVDDAIMIEDITFI